MPNPLNGVRVKINRAKKHLTDLESSIKAFDALHPYSVIPDKKTTPGQEIHRFWLNVPIPDEWAAILGDCIHNLRSALDLLAVELVLDGGGTPGDYTSFPIGSDYTHFRTSAIKRVSGASAQAIELICRLKPYRRENGTIWQIHRLDIADKHQLLIPVAAVHKMLGIQYHVTDEATKSMPRSPMLRAAPIDRKFPLRNGDILFTYIRVRLPFEDKSDFEHAFEIAFGEGQVFDGEAVIPTLTRLVDFIDRLVDIFARRIFRL
jgi:hypothetical protein